VITLRIFPKGEKKIANYKWQLHRAGLLNFWYYDEDEFQFADGKLLLRGNNGSGKSVTMQSFIPILLDGRKSPDRLDPFGSKARRMEDYLLGEKGVVDREERTGYLYLEYKKEGLEQYLTTGIGLRAKRGSAMNFWGFVILDNRRIGKDFLLYKKERSLGKEEKVPLTRVELENRLADGGRVVRTSKEYMNLVNCVTSTTRDSFLNVHAHRHIDISAIVKLDFFKSTCKTFPCRLITPRCRLNCLIYGIQSMKCRVNNMDLPAIQYYKFA
jgi:hypothetical protein